MGIVLSPDLGIAWPGFVLHIRQTMDAKSPLTDTPVRLVIWSRSYKLGNVDRKGLTPPIFWNRLMEECTGRKPKRRPLSVYECQKRLIGELVYLPVYLYDHSGPILKAAKENPFMESFESYLAGYAVCLRKEITDGSNWKEQGLSMIQEVVDAYNCYINCAVYKAHLMGHVGSSSNWEEAAVYRLGCRDTISLDEIEDLLSTKSVTIAERFKEAKTKGLVQVSQVPIKTEFDYDKFGGDWYAYGIGGAGNDHKFHAGQ